jgi:cytochrome c-type biogenesis protein CcsB
VPIGIFITSFGNFYLPQNMQLAVPLSPALKSNWLSMHVTVMLLSYASLILGSVLGILFLLFANNKRISEIYNYYEVMKVDNYGVEYLYHREDTAFNYEIDSNNESRVLDFRINLLEGIDELSYRLIGFGFPLLTVGVISGAIWANEAWGQYWCWDPKEVWSLITWTIFAAYLHSRFINTWKGKKTSNNCILRFCSYMDLLFWSEFFRTRSTYLRTTLSERLKYFYVKKFKLIKFI